jgi:hypothetical protein
MRPVARVGRWVWGLCGLVTATAIAVPGTLLILSAGEPTPARAAPPPAARPVVAQSMTRTATVPQPVTSLNVQDYGGLIHVTAAAVSHVEVTETIAYFGSPPAVEQSVSGGLLSLADPACANLSCLVSFAVKVPSGVSVTAAGGPMFISGTAGANLDSDGASVSATNIHGPLTVSTHGGLLQISGLTGPLHADTAGGPVVASGLTAATAAVTTGSGPAQLVFATAPESVTMSTVRGSVSLTVPGGPYALTANSDGAAQIIGVATSSAADRSITVSTGGGQLVISSRDPGNQLESPPLSTSSRRAFQSATLDPPRPATRHAIATVRPAGWLFASFLPSRIVLTCAARHIRTSPWQEFPAPAPGPDFARCRAH